jgi:DNA-binding CsgD family transcriptional regulator
VHSPLLSPTTTATQLTPRELQIARLAAAGHSAPKIAARFGLSPRTVNNHLGRAYDKLGITGRTQLRKVLTARVATQR